jgi:hypothetical protein
MSGCGREKKRIVEGTRKPTSGRYVSIDSRDRTIPLTSLQAIIRAAVWLVGAETYGLTIFPMAATAVERYSSEDKTMDKPSRYLMATLCFAMVGLLIYNVLHNYPLGIKDKVDVHTYLWVHFQVHNKSYFAAIVFGLVGIFLLTRPNKETPVPIHLSDPTPPPPVYEEGEIIEGFLELEVDGEWRRIHKHQLNEHLTDEQLNALKNLELWKSQQMCTRPTPAEAVEIHNHYYGVRERIMKTRPARMKV